MSYYASGCGSAVLKDNVDGEQLEKILDNIIDDNDIDIQFDFDLHNIYFYEDYGNWHEEDTETFLNALIPYIVSGTAEYSGEEDCYWRYVFDNEIQDWKEQNATIDYDFESYSDDDLIKELTKRGYQVSKIKD